MATINSYLAFDNNCREAMTFYKDCLGGELYFQAVKESPMAAQMPAHLQDGILHSTLTADGFVIMGTDMSRGQHIDGNTVSQAVLCTSEEEINRFFTKLSEGGTVSDPLMDAPWGAIFGSLTDKYGKQWMFNYNKE